MNSNEKRSLTDIGKIPFFQKVFKKLSLDEELDFEEKSYILACAIVFLKTYEKDSRFSSYADLSYYIILKYSLKYKDYEPLLDFSMNFGFYPIAKTILNIEDRENESIIKDCLYDLSLNRFKNKYDYIETIEQHLRTEELLTDESLQSSFIAPTSFGKSSLIVDLIRNVKKDAFKVVIVVPTKSLLAQTYKMIRAAKLDRKIIIHDEMYSDDDSSLIAVFTQERTLRLLNKNNLYFDLLIIDEAHNILKFDPRSILLSRLIKRNQKLNPDHRVIYLSPLVTDVENLSIKESNTITSHKINFNIKEVEIYEYRLDKSVQKYNRFVNQYYEIGEFPDYHKYIIKNAKGKNFLYNRRPIKIEQLAKSMCSRLELIEQGEEISSLENLLIKEVHEDFYCVDYLKYGLVYLHGKMPDLIKEYLEYKYKSLSKIKYVIANTVILEGMNLPIYALFILNTHSLNGKELVNLIGRVNRLNEVFSKHTNHLDKLLPPVHFVNNTDHQSATHSMSNKIKLLRSRVFKDEVKNPTLELYDLEKQTKNDSTKRDKIDLIRENEDFINNIPNTPFDQMKSYLIESSIHDFYDEIDKVVINLVEKLGQIKNGGFSGWDALKMLDKVNYLFVTNLLGNLNDNEVSRLRNEEGRNYYENYITVGQKKSLKENINSQFRYFKERIKSNDSKLYVGESYGEEPYGSDVYPQGGRDVYVDLSKKTDTALINLAIVKLKMEEDFVSFKLNKLIVMLFDYDLISEDEYNSYTYGTTNKKKINLTKSGLSISLISRLKRDKQIKNISIDSYGNLIGNDNFKSFVKSVDDLYRFEINRHILG